MVLELESLKSKLAKSEYRRALQNPAVAHCQKIWERVYRTEFQKTTSKVLARLQAAEAFRSAMPLLVGDENIRDFIGCVTFGSNSGILMEDTAAKLFYAAQVAYNVGSRRAKKSSNTLKSGHKSFGSSSLTPKIVPPPLHPTSTATKGLNHKIIEESALPDPKNSQKPA